MHVLILFAIYSIHIRFIIMKPSAPPFHFNLCLLCAAVMAAALTGSVQALDYQPQGLPPGVAPIPQAYAPNGALPPGAGLGQAQGMWVQPQRALRQTPAPVATRNAGYAQPYGPAQASRPAVTTTPSVQPMPSQYAPLIGGFNAQPVPYPDVVPTAPKPAAPATSASVAADVEALKHNDRLQDQRLSHLEAIAGGRPQQVTPAPAQPKQNGTHRVLMGETLSSIAAVYGMSVSELKLMNHRRSNVVMPGETLMVPARNGLASAPHSVSPEPVAASSAVHVVQKGETLSKIAALHHVSAARLQSVNSLRNPDVITLGQRLKIPGASTRSTASTSSSKSSKKNTPSASLLTAAAEPSSKAKAKSSAVSAPPAVGTVVSAPAANSFPKNVLSYRIEATDSIETVAKNFRTTPAEIQRLNKLPSTKLPPAGDEIVVPMPGLVSL